GQGGEGDRIAGGDRRPRPAELPQRGRRLELHEPRARGSGRLRFPDRQIRVRITPLEPLDGADDGDLRRDLVRRGAVMGERERRGERHYGRADRAKRDHGASGAYRRPTAAKKRITADTPPPLRSAAEQCAAWRRHDENVSAAAKRLSTLVDCRRSAQCSDTPCAGGSRTRNVEPAPGRL